MAGALAIGRQRDAYHRKHAGSSELEVKHVIRRKRKATVQELNDAPCKLHLGASAIFRSIARIMGRRQFLARGARVLGTHMYQWHSVAARLSPMAADT